MPNSLSPFSLRDVKLLPSIFRERFDLNRQYVMSLRNENLLQNHYLQAGLWGPPRKPEGCHWGWESPTSEVRGHFLGHWLSAAARIYRATDDTEIKAKADRIVAELARCQQENGGEWAGSIPPAYLDWVARGKRVWAPHYTIHKTLMGLYEMYSLAASEQALDILTAWARWFHRWTTPISRQHMDDILDVETGGMLEAWANLYGVTGRQEHLDLLYRYDRPRLFDKLLAGEDPLTNRHANTTIPEVQGAARAWEVTGERRWRDVVEAYWRLAVTTRGYFCTGGQTCGEIWTPPFAFAARLGDKNQEHCTVYNMMRLAEYLFRWTGDMAYADYWERNLYNGILAQQHPQTGMISYFLPLEAGAIKKWGTPTDDFWCCHGSLVQAHPLHASTTYYQDDEGLLLCQFIPTELAWRRDGAHVRVTLSQDTQTEQQHRPTALAFDLAIESSAEAAFALKIRLPWWLSGSPTITVNGEPQAVSGEPSGACVLRRVWRSDRVKIVLPKRLACCPLPDQPDTVAFIDGPVVLAGLCDEERPLYGDPSRPEALLAPDNEREWHLWKPGYRAIGQPRGLRFAPLFQISDERYTVYFPVRPA